MRLTKQCLYVATVRSIQAALGVNQDVVVGETNSSFLTNTHAVSSDILTFCPSSHISCLRYVRFTQQDNFTVWNILNWHRIGLAGEVEQWYGRHNYFYCLIT